MPALLRASARLPLLARNGVRGLGRARYSFKLIYKHKPSGGIPHYSEPEYRSAARLTSSKPPMPVMTRPTEAAKVGVWCALVRNSVAAQALS